MPRRKILKTSVRLETNHAECSAQSGLLDAVLNIAAAQKEITELEDDYDAKSRECDKLEGFLREALAELDIAYIHGIKRKSLESGMSRGLRAWRKANHHLGREYGG